VDYWEPAKWVAKLRHEMTGDTLLLLQTEMSAGHFGATGRQNIQQQSATFYTFILLALGMVDEQRASR
jgi:oligopeptidase B